MIKINDTSDILHMTEEAIGVSERMRELFIVQVYYARQSYFAYEMYLPI